MTDTDHILKLAEIIREVDGGNRLGAAALAEAILSHSASRWIPAIEPEGLTEEEIEKRFQRWWQRWGRPALTPIPAEERLPGTGDCDAEGRCWWWIIDQPGEFPHWIYAPIEAQSWAGYSAWLPHHALPVPASTTETP